MNKEYKAGAIKVGRFIWNGRQTAIAYLLVFKFCPIGFLVMWLEGE